MERSEATQWGRRTECCDCSFRGYFSSVKATPWPGDHRALAEHQILVGELGLGVLRLLRSGDIVASDFCPSQTCFDAFSK